jgi:ribonuclease PH
VTRRDGRASGALRPVSITVGWQETAFASALVELGRTKVLCAVTPEDRVPRAGPAGARTRSSA